MSDRPIQVGDLVQVVRGCPHCGCADDVGRIFIVDEILAVDTPMSCCGNETLEATAFPKENGEIFDGFQLDILKRIPPLDELESTRTDEPIMEPA